MDYLHEISKDEFLEDYSRCKKLVDLGVSKWFMLLNNSAIKGVKEIGGTTLDDLCDVFGYFYVNNFVFADYYTPKHSKDHDNDPEGAITFRFGKVTKGVKAALRGDITYFPKDCWVCYVEDGAGFKALVPFVQTKDGEVHFLFANPICKRKYEKSFANEMLENFPVCFEIKHILENLPEYFDCLFAIVDYNGVDMLIPIEQNSAKKTFKDRERDEFGVKRHLIHNVNQYKKENLKKDFVDRHLRGASKFTIDGIDVELCAGWELSVMECRRTHGKPNDRRRFIYR